MRILIAPDKFKFSLNSFDLCDIIADALLPFGHEVIKLPLADGGDGWLDIMGYYGRFESVFVDVHDPLFRKISARYIFDKHSKTAVVEMAKASGLDLLQPEERHCIKMSTYGTGELILHAIQNGAKTILLGIGGSASNDGGIGMANALGYQIYDKNGESVHPIGENLAKIVRVDDENLKFDKTAILIKVACDVDNPLYGKNGAAYVFAKQKGATSDEIVHLDKGLQSLAMLIMNQLKTDISTLKGGGAAGGVGAGAFAFLGANLQNGTEILFQFIRIDEKLVDIDLIIFGEGKIDEQSFMGKTLGHLHQLAQQKQIPLAVICGECTLSQKQLHEKDILFIGALREIAKNKEDSFMHSKKYVAQLIKEFAGNL